MPEVLSALSPIAAAPMTRNALGLGNAALAGAAPLQCGRLTLTSGAPVPTADVSSGSTLYFAPWRGNVVSIFDGADWQPYTFSELNRSLSGLTSGKQYDVFTYLSGGAVAIDLAPAWTSDTTRAMAVSLKDGVWVNDAAFMAVRSGDSVGQYQGTLVGTIRATGTSTTADSDTMRFVANVLQPIPLRMRLYSNAAHTYNTAIVRQWNNSSANRVQWVCPVPGPVVPVAVDGWMSHPNTGTNTAVTSLGWNQVSTVSKPWVQIYGAISVAAGNSAVYAPAPGLNYLQALQIGSGFGTTSFIDMSIEGTVWV